MFLPALILVMLPASIVDAHAEGGPTGSDVVYDCRNTGVIVSIGSYRCEGAPCTNAGVIVWVGHSCFSEGIAGACVAGTCEFVPEPKE